jgi:hypothetical protein
LLFQILESREEDIQQSINYTSSIGSTEFQSDVEDWKNEAPSSYINKLFCPVVIVEKEIGSDQLF